MNPSLEFEMGNGHQDLQSKLIGELSRRSSGRTAAVAMENKLVNNANPLLIEWHLGSIFPGTVEVWDKLYCLVLN